MRQATGRGRTPRRSCSGGRRSFTPGGAAEMEITWISIIVPVLNEAQGVSESLAALVALRERGHEVIVVDGGSSDETPELARRATDRVVALAQARLEAAVSCRQGGDIGQALGAAWRAAHSLPNGVAAPCLFLGRRAGESCAVL